jgi:HD-GYP domain-containing protein (c-di-GMP phosphodiesterase class II)
LGILDKPGRLDPAEEEIMRRHPVIGYEMLKDIPDISPRFSTACGTITNISTDRAIPTD